jgi:hypothetical protein
LDVISIPMKARPGKPLTGFGVAQPAWDASEAAAGESARLEDAHRMIALLQTEAARLEQIQMELEQAWEEERRQLRLELEMARARLAAVLAEREQDRAGANGGEGAGASG